MPGLHSYEHTSVASMVVDTLSCDRSEYDCRYARWITLVCFPSEMRSLAILLLYLLRRTSIHVQIICLPFDSISAYLQYCSDVSLQSIRNRSQACQSILLSTLFSLSLTCLLHIALRMFIGPQLVMSPVSFSPCCIASLYLHFLCLLCSRPVSTCS